MSSQGTPQTPPRFRFSTGLEQLESRDVPAVVTLPNYYQANQGQVLTIPASRGLLSNDFSDADFGAVLRADVVGTPFFGDFGPAGGGQVRALSNPVPDNTVTVNPDGSLTIVVPSNLPANIQGLAFAYRASNAQDPNDTPGTAGVIVYIGRPAAPRFAVAPQAGAAPIVNVYETGTGNLVQTIQAYDSSFTGGVRVAVADFNADGVPDVATAPGVGGGAHIKIFDGKTGRVLVNTFAFTDLGFAGGAHIAAGDINGDGFVDLVIGAGVGGGPRVLVANGQGFIPTVPGGNDPFDPGRTINPVTNQVNRLDVIMDFFAYEPSFRGGVRVAAGDVAGAGYDFIVTAPGGGGGPVVKTFDYFRVVGPPSIVPSGNANNANQIRQPLNQYGINANGSAEANLSFLAGDANSRRGVNISAGDVTGDGSAEIITGSASGPAVVLVFDGRNGGLLNQFGILAEPVTVPNFQSGSTLLGSAAPPSGTLIGTTSAPTSLFPGTGRVNGLPNVPDGTPSASQTLADNGVTVATADYNGDGKVDILAGSGRGNAPRVEVFDNAGNLLANFLAFPTNVLSGVNVG